MLIAKKIFFSFLLFFVCLNIWSQGEANIWYFGTNAGLSFNTNPPTPLTNGQLATFEGCASIADKNGDLVFYTDGITVWNKNHVAMTNGTGLLGNPSATQSAIIVPYPGTYNYTTKHFDKYFIVTVDYNGGTSGVRYSEVDMTLSGGLGSVTATKNIHLFGSTTSEKICVVQHANNCDFWVVAKPVGSVNYNTYLISSSGFNTTPVLSPAGPSVSNHLGSLKSSPNSKIVTATYGSAPNGLYVYDFNNATGILTLKFSDVSVSGFSYSQEFSPNNVFLYFTALNNPNIYQYDLTSIDNNAFLASKQVIGTTSNNVGYRMCALQIASDQKIYAALHGQNKLGVINTPNAAGNACNYVDMQQDLGGKTCQLGLPAIVTSLIRPVNNITLSDSCINSTIEFSLLDTSKIISYNWSLFSLNNPNVVIQSSNNPSFSKQVDSTGYYIIRAINQYSCIIDTLVDTIRIIPLPSIAITSSNVTCVGLSDGTITTTELGTNTPYSYLWNNLATTATINNLSPGNYIVGITDTKGCTSQDSTTITEPEAALTVDSVSIQHVDCFSNSSGSATLFVSGGTPPYTYSWNTTPVQTTIQASNVPQGNYTYAITDSNGCTTSASITINEPTALNLNVSNNVSVCQGASGTINSTASGGTGIYSYSWQPGGITNQNITLSPNITTNYTLTITDQNNCIAKDSASIIVNPNPNVNFGVPPVCVGEASVFSDSTTISSGTIVTYNWTFGIGSAGSIQQNPTYTYPSCNVYTISLTTISDSGCTSFNTKPVTVYCKPNASFTTNNICVYEQAEFNNTSQGATLFDWDFESNGTIDDTANSPNHTFLVGNYTTTLFATTAFGCKDTATGLISVFPSPVVDFSSDSVCLGNTNSFTNLTTIATPDSITTWFWDFDTDGVVNATTSEPTNIFSFPGNHTILLKATSNNGCVDSTIKNTVVYHLPNSQYSTSNVCDGTPLNFNDLSSIEGVDSIVNWNWSWGDFSSNTFTQNASHLYTNTGTYTVTLKVYSNNGCVDSISKAVVVNPNPAIYFNSTISAGCSPLCTVFSDSSEILSGNIVYWEWSLGNGDSIQGLESFEYCYNNTSTIQTDIFTPTLTVVSDSGCISTLSKPNFITVYPKPFANFSLFPETATITNPTIEFTNNSLGGESWEWFLGDSDTSTQFHPEPHTYADTGIYNVQLIATNNYNCIDTAFKQIIIEPDFMFYIPSAFSPNDDGINDTFIGKGMFITSIEMLIFDRWGTLVYRTDDLKKPWDGTINNGSTIAKQDVYIYSINVIDFKQNKHKFKGTVTLVN
ncbi:MAG: PKD domain-containing protein [Bacteroidia bacterium]